MSTENARLEPFVHTATQAGLAGLLHEEALSRPQDAAVISGDHVLTYAQLVRHSSKLASCLKHLGVTTDDCVGLFVDPSIELMTGAWGILFAGAAYLPLSPDYPEDRIRYMIEDSRTRVIVTQSHLIARLAEFVPRGTRIVTLADADEFPQAPLPEISPESLAYVIYTSGSTGKPKGVLIEHRSIASQMQWMHSVSHLGRTTTVLQKTPMSFDAAQWEILAPAVGSRVVMGARGSYRDPDVLVATIIEHGVTTLQCVPTLLEALLDNEGLRRCTSLRRVFSGGEALSRRLASAFFAGLPWASLVNLYGPTECTINATAYLVDPDTIGNGAGTVPIGIPVDNTQCFILDENLAPVDIGETGELYIGGVQLARGYLNRPDQTRERFIRSPFVPTQRVYRTGDRAFWNPDGTIQFAGRFDNQVKLRGYRVELDEVALAIEEHTWVKRAATVLTDDARTGFQSLVACVELNPNEAALMDQDSHGAHHQSKASKLQVKAQISAPGVRDVGELLGRPVIDLPGRTETPHQRSTAFGRKSYRFYEGGEVARDDLVALLAGADGGRYVDGGAEEGAAGVVSRSLDDVTFADLGELLRWCGQFRSDERLLAKYAYASPGSLYATQLYLETSGMAGLAAGLYYYHPAEHKLVRIGDAEDGEDGGSVRLALHFVGKKRAIEPVYKNNIQEVLEFETGHLVGMLEEVLPGYGLDIRPLAHRPAVKDRLDVVAEDYYLGTFAIRPYDGARRADRTEIYVQAHDGRVSGLPAGLYRYADGDLVRLSDDIVQAKHVIAINQQVYERASFGVTAVSRAEERWLEYICLGAKLHHLQRNGLRIGLMSSGYSSRSGNPLPAARRIDDILTLCGVVPGASYFFIGGRVSEEQVRSEGMYEDAVHMLGPAELIKNDLANVLPHYMIPSRVLVLDRLPLTANGKIDRKALSTSDAVRSARSVSAYVAPATRAERWLAQAWGRALRYDDVSVEDEFFESGGNSLTAVALVNTINKELGTRLPLQVVFESPKLADLAARIDDGTEVTSSRLVPMSSAGSGRPVFCWPGLGGYPMNLRRLAGETGLGRPIYGVQAYGLNAGEVPWATIRETAAADVVEIRRRQPEGPYTLWGYSFGARVAFETAWQLEQLGERVESLLLICPGNPKVRQDHGDLYGRQSSYSNQAYLTILFSVFAGSISGPDLERCLGEVRDEDGFVAFVHDLLPDLDEPLIRRITRIVGETYEFEYSFDELAERTLTAPVTIFRAVGDDYSFIEGRAGYSAAPPVLVDLRGDHYSVLKEHGVTELASAIRSRLGR